MKRFEIKRPLLMRASSARVPTRSARASTTLAANKKQRTPDEFTMHEQEQLATTSRINAELSIHPSAKNQKSHTPYHSIPSRLGKFSLQDKLSKPFKSDVQEREITEETTENEETSKLFITFDLLKTMTPRNCVKCLNSTPIFLRTLYLEGKLDPDIVSSVSLSLTSNELQKFMINMTQEINFYSALISCHTLAEIEDRLVQLITMKKAIIWIKSEQSDFFVSQSMKEALQLNHTILTESFNSKKDIITGDPANHEGFSVDYDLPLVRGSKSMVMLPILSPTEDVIAIFQCLGYQNSLAEMQTEFPEYYIETLKIVRDMLQKKFFTKPPPRIVPSNVSAMFSGIEKGSLKYTAGQISRFLQNAIPCEAAELYEFDDRYRCLVRLCDDKRFGELEGGISFQAGITTVPINVPHGISHSAFNPDIDGLYNNRSIFSKSIMQGRDHFVLTCRSKPNAPAFYPIDVKLIGELSPIICDALKLSKWIENQSKTLGEMSQELRLLNIVSDSLAQVSTAGKDRWETVRIAASQFFECDALFICLFDGRFMKYTPTEIKSKFEDCCAGTAYNYRETVWTKDDDENSKFNPSLYKQLKVECHLSLAFPYRANGRVCGAIEVINPKRTNISQDELRLFSNLTGCLMANIQAQK